MDHSSELKDLEENEADFGILFDVDGVLARGSTPLKAAQSAIRLLEDDSGTMKVPVAFVTNTCKRSHDRAMQIQKWLNIKVSPDQVIHAPTPAKLLTDFHDKHVLVVGQELRVEIAQDLGFTNVCTIDDVKKAYPLLDMVDHENRKAVATGTHNDDLTFPTVEAILLIGEPTLWETHLQLLIDLLLTEGKPTASHVPKSVLNIKQLPVIACNMDLVFMHQSCMPRYGHGAFLVCLEALYKKITGKDLEYKALFGKPCEITYRYAEHVISDVAKQLGIQRPIKKLYFVGDNPNVDIVGANLYDRYLKRVWMNANNGNTEKTDHGLPVSRSIPGNLCLYKQTVRSIESVLVGTGVYNPDKESSDSDNNVYHGHRDFHNEQELAKPSRFVPDVYHAGNINYDFYLDSGTGEIKVRDERELEKARTQVYNLTIFAQDGGIPVLQGATSIVICVDTCDVPTSAGISSTFGIICISVSLNLAIYAHHLFLFEYTQCDLLIIDGLSTIDPISARFSSTYGTVCISVSLIIAVYSYYLFLI